MNKERSRKIFRATLHGDNLKACIDQFEEAIVIVDDTTGEIMMINSTLCNLLEVKEIDLFGTYFQDHLHTEDIEKTIAVFEDPDNDGQGFKNRWCVGAHTVHFEWQGILRESKGYAIYKAKILKVETCPITT